MKQWEMPEDLLAKAVPERKQNPSWFKEKQPPTNDDENEEQTAA